MSCMNLGVDHDQVAYFDIDPEICCLLQINWQSLG